MDHSFKIAEAKTRLKSQEKQDTKQEHENGKPYIEIFFGQNHSGDCPKPQKKIDLDKMCSELNSSLSSIMRKNNTKGSDESPTNSTNDADNVSIEKNNIRLEHPDDIKSNPDQQQQNSGNEEESLGKKEIEEGTTELTKIKPNARQSKKPTKVRQNLKLAKTNEKSEKPKYHQEQSDKKRSEKQQKKLESEKKPLQIGEDNMDQVADAATREYILIYTAGNGENTSVNNIGEKKSVNPDDYQQYDQALVKKIRKTIGTLLFSRVDKETRKTQLCLSANRSKYTHSK
jgi:hypothetical protein